jgi:hypothetical protein
MKRGNKNNTWISRRIKVSCQKIKLLNDLRYRLSLSRDALGYINRCNRIYKQVISAAYDIPNVTVKECVATKRPHRRNSSTNRLGYHRAGNTGIVITWQRWLPRHPRDSGSPSTAVTRGACTFRSRNRRHSECRALRQYTNSWCGGRHPTAHRCLPHKCILYKKHFSSYLINP